MALNTGVYLLLSETELRANQSLNTRFKTSKALIERHQPSLKNEDNCLFCFLCNDYGAQTYEIMRE